jgi:alanyl-tRNA synthetase
MTAEQFTALGISDDLAKKAAAESQKELEGYVPKSKADEADSEIKNLKATIKTNEKALEELKKSTGDSAQMKEQIEQLQAAAREAETKYHAEMKEIQITNAIKLAIAGKVHDDDIAAGLIDKSKLVLGDDGKVVGLDEQIKSLQASKGFLFKDTPAGKDANSGGASGSSTGGAPYKPQDGESGTGTSRAQSIAQTLNNKATDNPYAKAWG